uniref:Uncharacterized protein n=1 Tax=Chrysotila carterae TaxID=13221 RepID=A0A7S4B920_CHRCT
MVERHPRFCASCQWIGSTNQSGGERKQREPAHLQPSQEMASTNKRVNSKQHATATYIAFVGATCIQYCHRTSVSLRTHSPHRCTLQPLQHMLQLLPQLTSATSYLHRRHM